MIVEFEEEYYAMLYYTPLDDIRGKHSFSKKVIKSYKRKIDYFRYAANEQVIRSVKSLHFEKLKGIRKGRYSVRLNQAYRLEFRIKDETSIIIEITNHYGD